VDLDEGEQQAIALAEELVADLLLVDEWDARLEAERRHLRAVVRCACWPTAQPAASPISKNLWIDIHNAPLFMK
jgi:hypothetical protein